MTPSARLQAAIDILDLVLSGQPAERALTNWARSNRFAGSKDRAAIRDHVFDALRCRGSFAWLGGVPEGADEAQNGRALMLGWARETGQGALFDGLGHGPAVPDATEAARLAAPVVAPDLPGGLAALDWPAWLRPDLEAALGARFGTVSAVARGRAPVFLRVNLARGDLAQAQARLAAEGIATEPCDLADTALVVREGARRLRQAQAYLDGTVELQDGASQAAVSALPLAKGMKVLDFCAGGGGKSLAMAARMPGLSLAAHDVDAARMGDLAPRAARAGAAIRRLDPGQAGTGWDLIVIDAPCSGAGTWRRTPDAKWRLTRQRLDELTKIQRSILTDCVGRLRPGGTIAYMTCSLLTAENSAQAAWACDEFGLSLLAERQFLPGIDGADPTAAADGFYYAHLQKP